MKPSIVFFGFNHEDWVTHQETSYFIDFTKDQQGLYIAPKNEYRPECSDAKIILINAKFLNDAFIDFLNVNRPWFEQSVWILIDDDSWQLEKWKWLFKKFKILRLISSDLEKNIQQAIENAWSIIREQEQNDIFNKLLIEKNLNLQSEQLEIKKEIQIALNNKKNNLKQLRSGVIYLDNHFGLFIEVKTSKKWKNYF
jgi:hypothetical protein